MSMAAYMLCESATAYGLLRAALSGESGITKGSRKLGENRSYLGIFQ